MRGLLKKGEKRSERRVLLLAHTRGFNALS